MKRYSRISKEVPNTAASLLKNRCLGGALALLLGTLASSGCGKDQSEEKAIESKAAWPPIQNCSARDKYISSFVRYVMALKYGGVEPNEYIGCLFELDVCTVIQTTADGWLIVSVGMDGMAGIITDRRYGDGTLLHKQKIELPPLQYLGLMTFTTVVGSTTTIPAFRMVKKEELPREQTEKATSSSPKTNSQDSSHLEAERQTKSPQQPSGIPPQVSPPTPAKGEVEVPAGTSASAEILHKSPPPDLTPGRDAVDGPSLAAPHSVIAASVKQSLSNARERAEANAAKLREAGFSNAKVYDGREFSNFKCCFWVVIVGAFQTSAEAAELRDDVKNAGFECYVKDAFKK